MIDVKTLEELARFYGKKWSKPVRKTFGDVTLVALIDEVDFRRDEDGLDVRYWLVLEFLDAFTNERLLWTDYRAGLSLFLDGKEDVQRAKIRPVRIDSDSYFSLSEECCYWSEAVKNEGIGVTAGYVIGVLARTETGRTYDELFNEMCTCVEALNINDEDLRAAWNGKCRIG